MPLFDTTNLTTKQKLLDSYFKFVDSFSVERSEKEFTLFTDEELVAEKGGILVFDSESFLNYFLISFKSFKSKKVVYFEDTDDAAINIAKLEWIVKNFTIVGFNSRDYDIPMLNFALIGYRSKDLNAISYDLITMHIHYRDVYKAHNLEPAQLNHIDLIEVAPLKASLKMYGARLHAKRLHELPIDYAKPITVKEQQIVRIYNINDLDLTELLLTELGPAIDLRDQLSREYQQDLYSKSDAQIAEAVISSELKRLNGYHSKRPTIEPGTSFQLKIPHYISYKTPQFKQMLETVRNARFIVGNNGSVEMPEELSKLNLRLGSCVYRMGIGGLHSSEECVSHKATDDMLLIDKDVNSYYPSIILTQELAPKHLGKSFLTVYKSIVDRRLEAKRTAPKGIVEQSLKITINGSFGKLGNMYSVLYAPDLLMQVTMTGQLALLMLIEFIESRGIPVVSANTDGVLVKCPKDRYTDLEMQVIYWQRLTGFETEETRYKAVYSRDVNNYIAIKDDGSFKAKGTFSEKGSSGNSVLSKNPETAICNDAVIARIIKGTSIEQTIRECKDIRKFVVVRNVKGGAEKSGEYLGKTIRWYYSVKAKGEINYIINGNKVPNSDGAMPALDLPDILPVDIDYSYYIKKAEEILESIGFYGSKRKQATLFY